MHIAIVNNILDHTAKVDQCEVLFSEFVFEDQIPVHLDRAADVVCCMVCQH